MAFETNEDMDSARQRNVNDALMEDIGRRDWTAELVPAVRMAEAQVVAKSATVVCGRPWFDDCLRALDAAATVRWHVDEGAEAAPGQMVCSIRARARALLSAERSALNFLQMLSAVATSTRQFVAAIEGCPPDGKRCLVLDTRKTMPGLRQAQKYAVRVGGGANHRMALWDGILIKENHIAAAGGIAPALQQAAALQSGVGIQIEVENLREMHEALAAGATNILLDDFALEDVRAAVEQCAGRAVLEVSGGVDLQTVRAVAATGVDRISIGKLTKDVRAADYSLRLLDD